MVITLQWITAFSIIIHLTIFIYGCQTSRICGNTGLSPYCYEHGKSLSSNVSLMVGKRILRWYVCEYRKNGAIDPDLGDFGDEMWDLKSTGIFLISLMGTEIRIYPDDSM
ncbi:hypothetical protein AVEN_23586-1 [Araneus ventricosus]|uniref:Uncharacterized protein n=1 Tax=Araneus ventricosus TaxID=182803 RepID=A0A4Y2PSY3_ARAVE|nr:hypothetical protein AVEN_222480-1 [Araneus ventricosus]GBN54366.1 hypothetical protein AVEN_23586-1 [Araneus ventricosus]